MKPYYCPSKIFVNIQFCEMAMSWLKVIGAHYWKMLINDSIFNIIR